MPGDRVEAEPIELEHGPARAALRRLIDPGPDRVDAGCDQHVACPGCQLRQLAGPRQIDHIVAGWQRMLRGATGLTREAIEARTREPVLVEPRDGYRTRAAARLEIVDGTLRPVMRARRGAERDWIDLGACPVQHRDVREALDAICRAIASCAGDGVHAVTSRGWLVVERAPHSAAMRITLTDDDDDDAPSQRRGQRLAAALHAAHPDWTVRVVRADPNGGPPTAGGHVLAGSGTLIGGLPDDPIEIPAEAWITATPRGAVQVARTLFACIDELMDSPDGLDGTVELGCGVGVHAHGLVTRVPGSYVGVDLSRAAIAAATTHAADDPRRQFRVGRADRALKRLVVDGVRASLVVIHPMRRGIGRDVGRYLGPLGASHVLHVSPTAGALADDARMLTRAGFELVDWQLVDTMPQTYHAMSIARFDRTR